MNGIVEFCKTGKKPIIIGHRGCAYAPENTIPSFIKAIENGADMIELDVQMSRDGFLVVIHDESLERTTDGRGRVIESNYKGYMDRLDAGSWFSPEYTGERIPLLQHVYEEVGNKIFLNVEIKVPKGVHYEIIRELCSKVLNTTEGMSLFDRVILSSFSIYVLSVIKSLNPRATTALLTSRNLIKSINVAVNNHCFTLNPKMSILRSRESISSAHRNGLLVFVWTINDILRAIDFKDMGVDGIFTDYPREIRQVISL